MPTRFPTHQHGFTLIELLVVAFIASLSAGMLLVNISFDSAEDKIEQQNIRLQSLLRFAHEQAIIRAEEYGVRFHQTGYRFMTLVEDRWIELTDDRHLSSKDLPEDMQFELYIEDIEITLNDAEEEAEQIKHDQKTLENENENSKKKELKIKPQVFLLSSGELTPEFNSRIRIPGTDSPLELKGNLNGQFILVKDDE